MGNEPAPYRRFRVANGLPIEGLYDSVVDVRLQQLLDAGSDQADLMASVSAN
ncbi:MAG: hypothetical protein ACO3IB_11620 [Phycisphaerales bacterium]